MNSFLRTFLASLLAITISVGFLFVIIFSVLIATIGSSVKTTEVAKIKPNSILKIDFSEAITESVSTNPMDYFDLMSMDFNPSLSCFDVIKSINSAEVDPNITAIYLDLSNPMRINIANLDEIREALIRFKESGKKIYSYADVYSQNGYFLSSVASTIYMCPIGGVEWKGIGGGSLFYKNTLDKFGVQVEVFKYGKYKSAVEPFLLSKMSEENRLQSERLYKNIWQQISHKVASSRGLNPDKLNDYASTLALESADKALELAFVDKLLYRDDAEKEFKAEYDSPNEITLGSYVKSVQNRNLMVGKGSRENQIAIIYADGTIMSGNSSQGTIGDKTLVRQIRKAADDKNVKAIVLRVNSPGGSALASDIIDREVRRAKEKKPIIASMGAYAASGGYYISANCDAIVASRLTLTGSIGVFGLMFNVSKGMSDILDLSADFVKSNPHADLGSQLRPMNGVERRYMQSSVNKVYETFVNCVVDGRGMTFESVDSIAQGRVWSGGDAVSIGLVDSQGGLLDAIALAADKADISEDYIVSNSTGFDDKLSMVLKILNEVSLGALVEKIKTDSSPIVEMILEEVKELEYLIKGDKIQAISPIKLDI